MLHISFSFFSVPFSSSTCDLLSLHVILFVSRQSLSLVVHLCFLLVLFFFDSVNSYSLRIYYVYLYRCHAKFTQYEPFAFQWLHVAFSSCLSSPVTAKTSYSLLHFSHYALFVYGGQGIFSN